MLLVIRDRAVFKKETAVLVKIMLVIWASVVFMKTAIKVENKSKDKVKLEVEDKAEGKILVKIEDKAWYKTIVEQVVKTVVKAQDKVKKVKMVNKKRGKMQHCQ